ncbi:hypothetical protein CYLTODRAFT_322407, partial [Cylindrobasidium torrendii FP15055 ss-10]
RKRRRNRTTQSCLNCHTSKRKCDRKRPCQRCIQLGLTGLCVYEIDDPALRDDPTIDETTRLRNRIAELESLVRELRGKPHPRWADSSFRDGDPSDKWHSRANKCATGRRRILSPGPETSPTASASTSSPQAPRTIISPIKTEAIDTGVSLYRFPESPTMMRYGQGYDATRSPSVSSYQHNYSEESEYTGSGIDSNNRFCSCSATNPVVNLGHHLESTYGALRQYPAHGVGGCPILRKVAELNDLLRCAAFSFLLNVFCSLVPSTDRRENGGSYDSNGSTDSEILTPISAPASFH